MNNKKTQACAFIAFCTKFTNMCQNVVQISHGGFSHLLSSKRRKHNYSDMPSTTQPKGSFTIVNMYLLVQRVHI